MPKTNQRSEFLKGLKKDAAALYKAAQTEAPTGYMEDDEILERLGIEDDETRVTVTAKLVRVSYGFDRNKNQFIRSKFVVTEGEHKGLPIPGDFFSLKKDDKEKYQKTLERVCGFLQRLGYDTMSWEKKDVPENVLDSADELTSQKPVVMLSVGAWERNDESLGLNTNIISLVDSESDSSSPEDDDAEESEEGEEQEDVEGEEDYENVEDDEEDEWDYSEWVGYDVSADLGEGMEEVTVQDYDEESGNFTVTASDDENYEVVAAECEFPEEE